MYVCMCGVYVCLHACGRVCVCDVCVCGLRGMCDVCDMCDVCLYECVEVRRQFKEVDSLFSACESQGLNYGLR